MDQFSIKEGFGVRLNKMNQSPDQILGLSAGGMEEDSISPMDVPEDFILRDEFLGVNLLHLRAYFLAQTQRHSCQLFILLLKS